MDNHTNIINYPEYVYHGTTTKYLNSFLDELIDTQYWQMDRDFGRGFYTTVDLYQAQEWAVHRAEVSIDEQPCVLQIGCKISNDGMEMKQQVFLGESQDWADFVLMHRLARWDDQTDPCGNVGKQHCDIVVGPMADNDTSAVVNEFRLNSYGRSWFYQNIRVSTDGFVRQGFELGNQIVFCSDKVARAILHLNSVWVYDEIGGWQRHEIHQ